MAHAILEMYPFCVHYSYGSLYSMIIIYSYSLQFIIRKVMNQQFYALSFNNLILEVSEPQCVVIESKQIAQIYFLILSYAFYRDYLNINK